MHGVSFRFSNLEKRRDVSNFKQNRTKQDGKRNEICKELPDAFSFSAAPNPNPIPTKKELLYFFSTPWSHWVGARLKKKD